MFDQTNRNTFNNLGAWIQEIRAVDQTRYIFLVGSKNDLPERHVTPEDVSHIRNSNHFTSYFQTSAKTGEGIQELFLYVSTLLLGKSSYT